MILEKLHAIGLTNLSDDEVLAFRQLRRQQKKEKRGMGRLMGNLGTLVGLVSVYWFFLRSSPEFRRTAYWIIVAVFVLGGFVTMLVAWGIASVLGAAGSDDDEEGLLASCFPSGALVATPFGETSIDHLKNGDHVLSWNQAEGRITTSRVRRIRRFANRQLLRIRTSCPSAAIEVTASHRLASARGWLPAGALSIGDSLQLLNRSCALEACAIIGIDVVHDSRPVYNLYVSGHSNYFCQGTLAHCYSVAPRIRQMVANVTDALSRCGFVGHMGTRACAARRDHACPRSLSGS